MKIGFIGQGWIGKHYADDFENRGYDVVRYALEDPYIKNKEEIKHCDIVFIAVPTPSKPEGFDSSILREAVKVVGTGKVAVIKSTLLPGITEEIQTDNPDIFIVHSPEFLREASAAFDVAKPVRNIVGIPVDNDEYRQHAKAIIDILPEAPYKLICHSREAELIKYGGNVHLYIKVVFMNMLHDLAVRLFLEVNIIKKAMSADSRIGSSHMDPVHQSGRRGAGGHCFIKDFAAFKEQYEEAVGDSYSLDVLNALQNKNNKLLKDSNKDLDLLKGVFGGIDNL